MVHLTGRVAIIHLASRRRIHKIFNTNGLSDVIHLKNSFDYTCCEKVLVWKNNRKINGYIVEETEKAWIVQLEPYRRYDSQTGIQ